MIEDHGLHVQLELVEKPQEHGVDLVLNQLLALIEVEVVLDEAPDLLLNGLGPTELGDLVEVLGHDTLGLNELVVMQGERVDLSVQILLLHLFEFFPALCQEQVDLEGEPEEPVGANRPLGQRIQENWHLYVLFVHQHHGVVVQLYLDALHVVVLDALQVSLLLVLGIEIGEGRSVQRNFVLPE